VTPTLYRLHDHAGDARLLAIVTLDNGTRTYDALLDDHPLGPPVQRAILTNTGFWARRAGAFSSERPDPQLVADGHRRGRTAGACNSTPGAQPGQPPTQTIVSAGQRNIASVAPVDERTFVRLTTPVRQNVGTATRDDVRTTLESVDIATGSESLVGVAPENPNTAF
jgi:hypothetical protein